MIQINECNEPLVDVLDVCADLVLQIDPVRQKNENTLRLRSSVAKMLLTAHKLLPEGITFVLTDAWRPMSAQKEYFEYYYSKFRREHGDWSDKEVYDHAAKFAIPPDQKFRAGHMTGAAVDLSLWKNGRRLPMQNRSLTFEQRAGTDVTQRRAYIDKNRKLLKLVMEKAGFCNYPKEYWHYSYGDTMWAEITGRKNARYGPIENL